MAEQQLKFLEMAPQLNHSPKRLRMRLNNREREEKIPPLKCCNHLLITSAPGTEEPQSGEKLKQEHVLMAPGIWRDRKYLPMVHKAVLL